MRGSLEHHLEWSQIPPSPGTVPQISQHLARQCWELSPSRNTNSRSRSGVSTGSDVGQCVWCSWHPFSNKGRNSRGMGWTRRVREPSFNGTKGGITYWQQTSWQINCTLVTRPKFQRRGQCDLQLRGTGDITHPPFTDLLLWPIGPPKYSALKPENKHGVSVMLKDLPVVQYLQFLRALDSRT